MAKSGMAFLIRAQTDLRRRVAHRNTDRQSLNRYTDELERNANKLTFCLELRIPK